MLAAHRDQENLVHSRHYAPSKQQPKTPGAKYPKTPSNFNQNDENAPTEFAGKIARGSANAQGGNGRLLMGKATGQRKAMVTPTENRTRAPLGNKTTNAKARTAQAAGVKDIVREIEKTQTKQAGLQKPKHRPLDFQSLKLDVQPDFKEDANNGGIPEPEYAPPRPTPLPYESDVLPAGGLTFKGLKKGNLLKGYYQHFHNPIDENGVSRTEKKFNNEIEAVVRKAEKRNAQEIAAMNWSVEDFADNAASSDSLQGITSQTAISTMTKPRIPTVQKQPPTLSARRAASALAVHTDRHDRSVQRPVNNTNPVTKRPLSSIISGAKPAKPVATNPDSSGSSTGEAASRTTLGYNKGQSASSMIHSRSMNQPAKKKLSLRPTTAHNIEAELTITPARMRQAASSSIAGISRPQFMSIFDDEDDEDLPIVQGPISSSDDEDEFELKLTI
ncbi:hypothetical protein QQS21_005568 [Conoideocrella luteorostrata]|uniref:Uncharacterized protein n=1 Tax=Conoideocrella luteorostrata TaxID=1105319 RepID=A0AAJ0CTH6_9HYPO|nr:hypothetical protein QQS21_005568 [Conoideocrella luteorostrata]